MPHQFILKEQITNDIKFPIGTVIQITDDYWPSVNYSNTGFTVVDGPLAGKKGCLQGGLERVIIEDTSENRNFIEFYRDQKHHLHKMNKQLDLYLASISSPILDNENNT